MSGVRTTPRYAVVATTRRSWSRAQKKAIIADIDVGGAALSEVARRHGIHSSLLFRWRKTLGAVMGAPPAISSAETSAPPTPRFMPVLLPPPSSPEPPSAHIHDRDRARRRRTVRVGVDVDTAALLRIVEALETCP